MRIACIALLVTVAGCSSRESTPESPAPAPPPANAPWRGAALTAGDVPSVFASEWRAAENRGSCALVAFTADVVPDEATPRSANFSGGWGVAYDMPELRSAFGIAGTGASPSPDTYDDWPFRRTWSDGSSVGYGPEGGTGPNQLAYLRIAGQHCLYNVWSRLGRSHLEELLSAIRFVDT